MKTTSRVINGFKRFLNNTHTIRNNVNAVHLNAFKSSAFGISIITGVGLFMIGKNLNAEEKVEIPKENTQVELDLSKYGKVIDSLPEYTREQIEKKNNKTDRIWVTFKYGVYDVTDFVEQHPGGEKILLAAGNSVEPYWSLYAVHKCKAVLDILEAMRIGNLSKKDRELLDQQPVDDSDPYKNDPSRFPGLVVRNKKPFNAETPLTLLADKYITPNEIFFVRNHLPVPHPNVNEYKLQVTGRGIPEQVEFTLDQLKNTFESKTIAVTLQCAGNRRGEMNKAKPVKGLEWGSGAISTAEWTGVLLSDVLKHANFRLDDNINHVQFEGMDIDPEKKPYGASIPVHRAIDPEKEVLLAYKMNGQDIPADHGYPLRVIIPGVVGARNVKWLSRIVVSDEESPSFWQRYDYKGFSPAVEQASNQVFDDAVAIQELPVQSSICEPKSESTVNAGDLVTLKGYAWSGGGRSIIRVDVKSDQDEWIVADLSKEAKQRPGKAWAWTPFEVGVEVPEDFEGKIRYCSRAVDDSYNVQPENVENIWTFRGVLANAWSCINLNVQKINQLCYGQFGSMSVFRLKDEDYQEWAEMWRLYLEFYNTTLPESQYHDTWSRIMADDGDLGAFVLKEEGRIVGLAHYLFHASSWTSKRLCYLNDLYVLSSCRGKGYGKVLIMAVKQVAQDEECLRLYWATKTDNPARKLYDKLGTSDFVTYRVSLE
ncbi:sulfite oxidase [Acrasis kona]|uniref:sulfite oxidase n=1 Tax=Acrasis kona TaxID=1008807 RepID=A0AAW2ZHD9_9EUKA